MTQLAAHLSGTPHIPAWAHHAGILNLGETPRDITPEAKHERDRIIERVARYCWAYDERRADRLADCFTEDAVWEGDVLHKVPIGPFKGRQTIIDWLTGFWPHQHDQRRHMILNHLIEAQDSTSALSLSYLLLLGSTGRSVSLECTGFYRCEHRLVEGMWQIARMTAGFDAPFWPGDIDEMSQRGRKRHGIRSES